MSFMLTYLQELCLQDAAMSFLLGYIIYTHDIDAAILCNINTSGYICMVYMYCFEYYGSCKASTIAFPDNGALSDEFLVRIHVALGPTLEMLL